MRGEIPAFYTEASFRHSPQYEILNGQKGDHEETAKRALNIAKALRESGFVNLNTAVINGMPWIEQVHSAPYLKFLQETSRDINLLVPDSKTKKRDLKAIYPSVHPYNRNPRATNSVAEMGLYMFDTYTPILIDTYEAAIDSASCAIAGAQLLTQGENTVYSLTRPPGHHAEKAMMGGYCYINNAAVAAEFLKTKGAERVAIFDFDLHHGNGTQDIFYDRPDVLFVSIHADPKIKFPYYTGYEDEVGDGQGRGANYNFPLPGGTGDEEYHKKVEEALGIIKKYEPNYLIVSAGFDTHAKDPIGAFNLSTKYYQKLGRSIVNLGIPTLTVQEGGYATKVLGSNVVSYLKGLTEV